MSLQIMSLGFFSLLIAVHIPPGISPWSASSAFRVFFRSCTDFFSRYSSSVVRNALSNLILSSVSAFLSFLRVFISFLRRHIWVLIL